MFRRRDKGVRVPPSLRRSFVTPEGVDLRLELASAGTRASAFMIDVLIILGVLILGTIGIALLGIARAGGEPFMIL